MKTKSARLAYMLLRQSWAMSVVTSGCLSHSESLTVVVLVLMLATMLLVVTSPTAVAARNVNPRILPPNSTPYGQTYGGWSAEWWQWAFSLPVDENPFFDRTGCANGANGQHGPVWFLTGVINVSGTAERTCTVPAGKALFFPLVNTECSTIEGNGSTEAELRACAEASVATVTEVHAEIDGVPVKNLQNDYLFESPLFEFTLPDNNVLEFFGVPGAVAGATSPSLADGFNLMLAPLSRGEHTVNFGGTFGGPSPFTLDITYHLTVK